MSGGMPIKFSEWKKFFNDLEENPLWIILNKRKVRFNFLSSLIVRGKRRGPKIQIINGAGIGFIVAIIISFLLSLRRGMSTSFALNSCIGLLYLTGLLYIFSLWRDLFFYTKQIKGFVRKKINEDLAMISWNSSEIYNALILGPAASALGKNIGFIIVLLQLIIYSKMYDNNALEFVSSYIYIILFGIAAILIIINIFLLLLIKMMKRTMRCLGFSYYQWGYVGRYSAYRFWHNAVYVLSWASLYAGLLYADYLLYFAILLLAVNIILLMVKIKQAHRNLTPVLSEAFTSYLAQNYDSDSMKEKVKIGKNSAVYIMSLPKFLLSRLFTVEFIIVFVLLFYFACAFLFMFTFRSPYQWSGRQIQTYWDMLEDQPSVMILFIFLTSVFLVYFKDFVYRKILRLKKVDFQFKTRLLPVSITFIFYIFSLGVAGYVISNGFKLPVAYDKMFKFVFYNPIPILILLIFCYLNIELLLLFVTKVNICFLEEGVIVGIEHIIPYENFQRIVFALDSASGKYKMDFYCAPSNARVFTLKGIEPERYQIFYEFLQGKVPKDIIIGKDDDISAPQYSVRLSHGFIEQAVLMLIGIVCAFSAYYYSTLNVSNEYYYRNEYLYALFFTLDISVISTLIGLYLTQAENLLRHSCGNCVRIYCSTYFGKWNLKKMF